MVRMGADLTPEKTRARRVAVEYHLVCARAVHPVKEAGLGKD